MQGKSKFAQEHTHPDCTFFGNCFSAGLHHKILPGKICPLLKQAAGFKPRRAPGMGKNEGQETQIPALDLPVGLSPAGKHLNEGRFAHPGCSSLQEGGEGMICLFVLEKL